MSCGSVGGAMRTYSPDGEYCKNGHLIKRGWQINERGQRVRGAYIYPVSWAAIEKGHAGRSECRECMRVSGWRYDHSEKGRAARKCYYLHHREAILERLNSYYHSEEGRAAYKRYNHSEEGLAAHRAAQKRYRHSEKGKATKRRYLLKVEALRCMKH